MKTEIKKLTRLVNLALSANNLFPVSGQEILHAFNNLENAIQHTTCSSYKPATIKKNIDRAVTLISGLMYNMHKPELKKMFAGEPLFTGRLNILYKQLNKLAELYKPHALQTNNHALMPLDVLCKTINKLEKKMLQCWGNTQPFTILQPHITALHKTKQLPYHRWHWWSYFWCAASPLLKGKEIELEDILTGLNFNTPEYISWLLANIKREVSLQQSVASGLDYLSGEIVRYKLLAGEAPAFIPAFSTIKHIVLDSLKYEHKLLLVMPGTGLPGAHQPATTKLNTGLSMPQLALFIRLMIDTKVISETNQSALFKNIATVVSTSKAASISSESLRINYYTPNNSAKSIVKDYLLNMINLLHSY